MCNLPQQPGAISILFIGIVWSAVRNKLNLMEMPQNQYLTLRAQGSQGLVDLVVDSKGEGNYGSHKREGLGMSYEGRETGQLIGKGRRPRNRKAPSKNWKKQGIREEKGKKHLGKI